MCWLPTCTYYILGVQPRCTYCSQVIMLVGDISDAGKRWLSSTVMSHGVMAEVPRVHRGLLLREGRARIAIPPCSLYTPLRTFYNSQTY